jgi:hypothetical protein
MKHHLDHKIQYISSAGSYDDAYNEWYQLVRADHDSSGAPKRPIYREISQIIRLKSVDQDYLLIGETLIGFDHENNPIPFFHTYGRYSKPYFRTVYNYELKRANTIRSGQSETVYFLKYDDKNLMDTLYTCGPDDQDIELLVNIGSKQYGGRGFFTYDEFRNLTLEELGRIGRKGKEMFSTTTTNVPVGSMISQLKAEGTSVEDQKLWNEFREFQKFKQSQFQLPSPTTIDNVNVSARKVKITAPDENK